MRVSSAGLATLILLFFLLAGTSAARAVAIGISPPTVDLELDSGTEKTQETWVSRSETSGRARFVVSVAGDPVVALREDDVVEIPEGENGTRFSYVIDASDLDPGDYDARVQLVLDEDFPSTDGSGNVVRAALIQQVHVRVVESDGDWTVAAAALVAVSIPLFLFAARRRCAVKIA